MYIATVLSAILCITAVVIMIKGSIQKKIPFETEITVPEPKPMPNPFKVK